MTNNVENKAKPSIIDPIDEPIIAQASETANKTAKKPVSHLATAASPQVDSSKEDGRELDAENNNVARNYIGYGGAVGGGLIGLLVILMIGGDGIIFALIAILFGVFIGMIPAAITGMLAEYYHLERNFEGLIKVSGIGAIVTLFFWIAALYIIKQANFEWTDISSEGVMFALTLGGMSAFLTGLGALPKPCHSPSTNID